MDTNEIKTLCLKHVYGTTLTDVERALVDDYSQTTDGSNYLRECREMKNLLKNLADIRIKPVDHESMVRSFESTVRRNFEKTIFRPWWEANSPPIILGLFAGLLIAQEGWTVINSVLLGICVLWLITDSLQRHYFAKILSRSDLYEYAKASRRRSDRILQSLPGLMLRVLFSGLAIAALSFVTYRGYQEYGYIVPAIVIFVLVESAIIVGLQFRKVKRSDPEVWDWWAEEIKE